MPLITNGEQTFEASDKAFSLIYAERGFALADGDNAPATVAELKVALDALGVEYPKGANKAALIELHEAALAPAPAAGGDNAEE